MLGTLTRIDLLALHQLMIYPPLEQWILRAHRSVLPRFRPDVVSVIESSDLSVDTPWAGEATLTSGFLSDRASIRSLDHVPRPVFPYVCFRWNPTTKTAVVHELWGVRYGAGWELTFDAAGEVVRDHKAWAS